MSKDTKTLFRCYLTIEQDENFINRMAADGWKLVKIYLGMGFKFTKCEPNEYICSTMFVKASERDDICELLIDSGAEVIPEINIEASLHMYAIRKSELGEFILNSNIDSKIADYNKKIQVNMICGILFFIIGLIFFYDCSLAYSMISYNSLLFFNYLIGGILETIIGSLMIIVAIKYIQKNKVLKQEREIGE